MEKERSVRRAHQAVRSGDHIECVISLLLPGMVYDHQANAVGVSKGLEPGNDLIVVGVAVIVPSDFPDLLKRVYDDQRGIRVLPQKTGELFIQTLAELPGRNGEEQVFILRRAKHPIQTFLHVTGDERRQGDCMIQVPCALVKFY